MHFEATGLIRSFLQSYAIRASVGYPLGVIFQSEFHFLSPDGDFRNFPKFQLKDDPEGVPHTRFDGVRLRK